jgi:hypothetical protein
VRKCGSYYHEIIISGNADVINGDTTTSNLPNDSDFIPNNVKSMGSQYNLIHFKKGYSGIAQNGSTGPQESKYNKIILEAEGKPGQDRAIIKDGAFENVELQNNYFKEMRAVQEERRGERCEKKQERWYGRERERKKKSGKTTKNWMKLYGRRCRRNTARELVRSSTVSFAEINLNKKVIQSRKNKRVKMHCSRDRVAERRLNDQPIEKSIGSENKSITVQESRDEVGIAVDALPRTVEGTTQAS